MNDVGHSARHRRTTQAILEAAAHVLAETPDASVDDVAHAADVGRATLYRHFASREALVAALRDEAVEEIGRRLAEASLDRVPVTQAVERIVRATLVVGERYSVLMREKPERLEHHRVNELVRRPIRSVFERGVAEGLFRDDVSLDTLVALFGGVLGAGARLVSEQAETLEDAIDATTSLTLSGLLRPT